MNCDGTGAAAYRRTSRVYRIETQARLRVACSVGGEKARNPRRSAGFWNRRRLDGADALGLRPLLALPDLELNPLALVQGLEAGAGNLGVVDEDVGTATVLRDETEA